MRAFQLMTPLLFLLGLFSLACTKSDDTPSSRAHVLEFIENDYETALALARERDVPIFIESWAPW